MGLKGKDGALSVGSTQKFNNLISIEKKLTEELGSKATIRIFSKEGFEKASKTAASKIGE